MENNCDGESSDGTNPAPIVDSSACVPLSRWFEARNGSLTDSELRHVETCARCQSQGRAVERVASIPDDQLVPRLNASEHVRLPARPAVTSRHNRGAVRALSRPRCTTPWAAAERVTFVPVLAIAAKDPISRPGNEHAAPAEVPVGDARASCSGPSETVLQSADGRRLRVFPHPTDGLATVRLYGAVSPCNFVIELGGRPVPLLQPFNEYGYAVVRSSDLAVPSGSLVTKLALTLVAQPSAATDAHT